jgi:hypothetical protein
MARDEELMLIFGALHLIALGLGTILFVMFLKSDSGDGGTPPEEDDSGGGGNDRLGDRPPKTSPSGGLPLPDAEPAPVRLRAPGRLADLLPRRERRRVAEPEPAPGRRRVPSR